MSLDYLYAETETYHALDGKLSIDPVVILKICLIGYLFGTTSLCFLGPSQLIAYTLSFVQPNTLCIVSFRVTHAWQQPPS